jgi:hypothetical protein
MLFKMLTIELAAELGYNASTKPRQVFVTQSPVLANRVDTYFRQLCGSRLGDPNLPRVEHVHNGQDGAGGMGDLPSCFSALEDHHFPLFVSYTHVSRAVAAHCSC